MPFFVVWSLKGPETKLALVVKPRPTSQVKINGESLDQPHKPSSKSQDSVLGGQGSGWSCMSSSTTSFPSMLGYVTSNASCRDNGLVT